MTNYELISASIYNPKDSLFKTGANDRAQVSTIHCSNKDNCELYKRGSCLLRLILGGGCPYGKYSVEKGPTKRSKGLYTWISKKREDVKSVKLLDYPSDKISIIGKYVWIPYPHVDMCTELPFYKRSSLFVSGTPFLEHEHFTVESMTILCNFVPRTLIGSSPINRYQAESVPKLLRDLRENFPDIYNELVKAPGIKEKDTLVSHVGREAYLSTVVPNVGSFTDIHGGVWSWDGKYLLSLNAKMSFGLTGYKEVRLLPADKAMVKITQDAQVGSNTIFKE